MEVTAIAVPWASRPKRSQRQSMGPGLLNQQYPVWPAKLHCLVASKVCLCKGYHLKLMPSLVTSSNGLKEHPGRVYTIFSTSRTSSDFLSCVAIAEINDVFLAISEILLWPFA